LAESRRVLAPGGTVLAAFHAGNERVHLDDWWDHNVDVTTHYHERSQQSVCLRLQTSRSRHISSGSPWRAWSTHAEGHTFWKASSSWVVAGPVPAWG
jgi:hypothetical protein